MNPTGTPPSRPVMHKTLLDGQFNLFTFNWHGDNVQNLLILAHGAVVQPCSIDGIARRITGVHRFAVPLWTTLFFYAPHGYVLLVNAEDVMTGKEPPLEAILPGEMVINYDLGFEDEQYPLGTDQDIEIFLFNSRCNFSCSYFSQHPFRVYDIITTEPSDLSGTRQPCVSIGLVIIINPLANHRNVRLESAFEKSNGVAKYCTPKVCYYDARGTRQ